MLFTGDKDFKPSVAILLPVNHEEDFCLVTLGYIEMDNETEK